MNWDHYFFEIVNTVAKNSKCLSRQVGSILVSEKNVLVSGYNGPPVGVPHCNERYNIDMELRKELDKREIDREKINRKVCPRYNMGFKSGQGLEWCIAGHAERNVLITAAKHGISTNDLSMYMNCPIPCSSCLIEIINAGIREIVVAKLDYYDIMSSYLISNSNLLVRKYRDF